jgi:ribosome-associated protein
VSRQPLVLDDGRVIPADCFDLRFARSGGPGGQHVNKTESKVDLRLDLAAAEVVLGPEDVARIRSAYPARLDADGRLQVTCEEHRSRFQNLEAAIERMRRLLRAALARRRKRVATKPTWGSKKRRLQEKRHRGEIKRGRSGPGGEG